MPCSCITTNRNVGKSVCFLASHTIKAAIENKVSPGKNSRTNKRKKKALNMDSSPEGEPHTGGMEPQSPTQSSAGTQTKRRV